MRRDHPQAPGIEVGGNLHIAGKARRHRQVGRRRAGRFERCAEVVAASARRSRRGSHHGIDRIDVAAVPEDVERRRELGHDRAGGEHVEVDESCAAPSA